MNPSSNETSGLSLPAPVPEQSPAGYVPQENMPAPAEIAGGAERAPMAAANAQPTPSVAPPVQMPIFDPAAQAIAVPSTTQSAAKTVLKDDDLIEKEVVERAKRVIASTHDDPYKQTEELSVLKNDYMQKNYNKPLKLNK
jgi:hypothetical protein